MFSIGCTRWPVIFAALQAASGNDMFQDVGCHASLLQMAVSIPGANNISMSSSTALSTERSALESLLQRASEECPKATERCLSSLTDLRLHVWPYVQEETNWSGWAWLPEGMDSEQAIGDVSCFEEKAMYYRHIWKSAGHSVFENLEKVSTNFSQEGLSYAQFCERYNSVDGKDHVGFTFVRHPIARFISGYAEIESRARDGNPTYTDLATTLKEYPVGSPRRAAAFFREFLRTGVNRDGHVKPQLEFMIPNAGCSVPMGFIGKTESMEDDWIRMFGVHQCNLSSPFDQSLGLHPNDEQDKTAMETILGWTGTSTIEPVDSSYNNATPSAVVLSEASADVRAIVAALQENGSRYLRALCWLLLADFVSFRFDMPAACRSGLLHKSTFALLRAEPASSTAP